MQVHYSGILIKIIFVYFGYMKSPLNIHPPKNWQDFETLCLKLWGEVWNIPHEIEFNSDNAQGQNGVDIYGPVDNGKKYYGIQCKNKKLNLINGSPNRITTKDIQIEIDKARDFKPSLSKLIIATSLPKDQAVEEYVRIKSLEYSKKDLFSIQICFWDFFERKLFEFPSVYNWYVKNEEFSRVSQLSVTFKNGEIEKIFHPKFQKNIVRYSYSPPSRPSQSNDETFLSIGYPEHQLSKLNTSFLEQFSRQFDSNTMLPRIEWRQICWFQLHVVNTGQAVIEDYKIELEFDGSFETVEPESRHSIFHPGFKNDIKGYNNSDKDLCIIPFSKTLVQKDSFVTGSMYVEPKVGLATEIKLHWKLLSRDFNDSGTLMIKIEPKFHEVIRVYEVDDLTMEGDDITYSIIKRPGSININGTHYIDKESDYTFK